MEGGGRPHRTSPAARLPSGHSRNTSQTGLQLAVNRPLVLRPKIPKIKKKKNTEKSGSSRHYLFKELLLDICNGCLYI